jgi:hypothetical protein
MADGSPTGRSFPCDGCGAALVFSEGLQKLSCAHCGNQQELTFPDDRPPQKKDLRQALRQQAQRKTTPPSPSESSSLACRGCGAVVVFAGSLTSTACAWCETPLVLKDAHTVKERIAVDGLCTFVVDQRAAHGQLAAWVSRRWFAPGDFVQRGVDGKFAGAYLPFFLFDAATFTRFSGERGDVDYVEQPTVTTRAPQRQRRVRWSSKSGAFQRLFTDVCVPAVTSLPSSLLRGLAPWPLHRLLPFSEDALAGKQAHRWEVALDDCFAVAEDHIHAALDGEVRRRIGGDEQRVHRRDTALHALAYQHVLLPVWVLAYRYRGDVFRVVVTAATGLVRGERPWSVAKIAAAVVVAAVILLALALKFRHDP